MATINHKTYNEATETFKDFNVYDGKETLIFKVDGADQTVYASNIIGSGIIKTSDNGPLSATAKYLSDGLGNNSVLALSTSRVGINQSNPTSARLEIVESTTAEALRVDGSGSGFALVVNGGTSYKSAIRNASIGASYFSTAAPSNGLIVEGNVGIGTSSPAYKLEVFDAGGSSLAVGASTGKGFLYADNGGATLGALSAIPLRFSVNGSEHMRITSAGNVGIGTNLPEGKLHVLNGSAGSVTANGNADELIVENSSTGGLSILTPDASTGYIMFGSPADNEGAIIRYQPTGTLMTIGTEVANGALAFRTATGTERMRITSAGNVGIGTSTANTLLSIDGAADNGLSIQGIGTTSTRAFFGLDTSGDGYMSLTNGGTFATNVQLTSDLSVSNYILGNVGIGTSSPTSKLHVQGTSYFFDQSIFSDKVGIGTSSPNAKLESLDGDIKVTTQSAFAGFITSRNTIPSSGGTQLGRLQYSAYSTGTTYVDGAAIQAFSTEAWSASSTPSWLSLQTVASGSTSLVERVRIDSDGLKFNGDTAAANALDDYEEGTFTPTFAPTSGAFTSITYSEQYGKYTKIGNRVDINIQVSLSAVSVGTAGGVIFIGGLPFTVGAKPCPFSISIVQNWASGKFPVNGFFNDGASDCLLRYVSALNANDAYIGGADITNTSSITLSGTYFV
jgi:hypothetical protein